jgi:hypothetical protein
MRIPPMGVLRKKFTLLGLGVPYWIILIIVLVLLRG